jgi:hypothetical protein
VWTLSDAAGIKIGCRAEPRPRIFLPDRVIVLVSIREEYTAADMTTRENLFPYQNEKSC